MGNLLSNDDDDDDDVDDDDVDDDNAGKRQAPTALSFIPHIQAYAASHGIVMVSKTDPRLVHHAPVSMLPFPFPRRLFLTAVELAEPFNFLVDAIARDEEWLLSTLSDVLADPFTERLVRLYKEHGGSRATQPMCLGIHRSDYMVDEPDAHVQRLRQIELNTISASFACLSARVADLHRFLLMGPGALDGTVTGLPAAASPEAHLPPNGAELGLAAALAQAHAWYPHRDRPRVVAFVVQEGERNEFDQRHLEFTLFARHGVHVKRVTLANVHDRCRLRRQRLVLDGQFEITVVYFRAAYRPEDLPGEKEWAARALIERSLAVKCPSVGYHLAGTKKVQQALAAPGAVERFLRPELAAQVRGCFAGLWSLGGDADEAVVRRAIEAPRGFVLKPQREGGGNNYFGDDVSAQLKRMSRDERAAHILMERVFPKAHDVALLREGQPQSGSGICELGIYSVFLGDGANPALLNKAAGHLLRTKLDGVNEGGVASGFACLDSPFLTF